MMKQHYLILGLTLCLSACSLLSPVPNNPAAVYLIDQTPSKVPMRHARGGILLVMPPEVYPAYDTTQIAYTIKPHEISYYSQNFWVQPPSQMLEPLMVQTLQKSHQYRYVTSPPFGGHYDYLLTSQLTELKIDFMQCPAVLRLVLRAQLTNINSNQVIAAKTITVNQPLSQADPYNGIIAANQAVTIMLRQLAAM